MNIKANWIHFPSDNQHNNIFNVVVGFPIGHPKTYFESDPFTHTHERFLPQILKNLGVVQSLSQVKRDRPDLYVGFPDDHTRYYPIVVGNPKKVWQSKYLQLIVGTKYFQDAFNIGGDILWNHRHEIIPSVDFEVWDFWATLVNFNVEFGIYDTFTPG